MVQQPFSIRSIFVLIAAAAALGFGLQFVQRFTGALQLQERYGAYGGVTFAGGSKEYPRIADDAGGYALKMARPTRTVASQGWSIDEFVYTITPPEGVVAVSEYAYEPASSNVLQWANLFHPAVAADPETLLKLQPDLVLVSSDADADFTQLLRAADMPTFRMFTSFTSLNEIVASIRLVGYLTGRDSEAERLAANFEEAVRRGRARKPASMRAPRVLGFSGSFSYGDQTLFDDILRTLGAVNVGAENGLHGYSSLNTEQIIAWNPEWIIADANRGGTEPALRSLLQNPAIATTTAARNGHVVVLENNVFKPMSPFTALLLNALGDALYGPSSESRQ